MMLNRKFQRNCTVACLSLGIILMSPAVKSQSSGNNYSTAEKMQSTFLNIPDSIQTSVYWYWISGNISKEGVVKDLQSMKKVGINRAFIGNIGDPQTPYGKVKFFSDEWWDITHTALKTATDLGIDIGLFNSPGWSQSGGPWIKTAQSMRYLASTETLVKGGKTVNISLKKPAGEFQDVKVIAFPAPEAYGSNINQGKVTLSASLPLDSLNNLIDNDDANGVHFQEGKPVTIDFKTTKDYTARSLIVYPLKKQMSLKVTFQVKQGNEFKTISAFAVDRSNTALNVGFKRFAPVAISVPATRAKAFRLIITSVSNGAGLAEVTISSAPHVERFIEKTLAKMFPTPLPYWNEYQWPLQPKVADKNLMIDPLSIVDLSKNLSHDGQLNWKAPKGDWVVMRTGMLTTGVVNDPAPPEGTGLEVDKMSRKHVAYHFSSYLGYIMSKIPAEDRKSFKVAVQDSYEKGGQNWTDSLLEKFQKRYGYDALPYLPAMEGKVVGSPDQTDRFLWDLRRFVADNVAFEYVGGLRDIAHKNGLTIWLENYGHWGFPAEFLQYGGQSDEVGGEFWSEGELGNIENRAASSSAHIYGKNKVSAESFTAGGNLFGRYPLNLKQRGDRFFTEGINNSLLHVYISQPDETKKPGINAWFGTEFNRLNTWFFDADMFIKYLKRCNYMLQQGTYVADVAYFIGEDAPKMTGVRDPEIPFGYSYDYINAEVIEQRIKVINGRLVLPDGMSYKMLVLPKLETMRPELLTKIKDLINQGAIVLGPKPSKSPSLQDYPNADKKIKAMADELWTNEAVHTYGKGLLMNGITMQQAFDQLKVIPDFKLPASDSILYIHRKLEDGELYFISNQSSKLTRVNPEFRVTGKQPELLDGITGKSRDLPAYTANASSTTVPLQLEPLESAFILFKNPASANVPHDLASNFPEIKTSQELTGPWKVSFDIESRGPKKPVVFNKLTDWSLNASDSIKYYSGTAYYRKTIKLIQPKSGERIYLDLGKVSALAKVKLNGKDVGGVWTYPFRVDITDAILKNNNQLEIKVVNTWVNRLVGDSKLPADQRKTWTSFEIYKPNQPLQTSGLLGPVKIELVKYLK
jgi:hypothetical protein